MAISSFSMNLAVWLLDFFESAVDRAFNSAARRESQSSPLNVSNRVQLAVIATENGLITSADLEMA